MEQILNQIHVSLPDCELNGMLANIPDDGTDIRYAVRFNHNEELFLELDSSFLMPRFPIHHDIGSERPSSAYLDSFRILVQQITGLLPELFRGLTYFFDPTEPLKPRFYRIYKVENSLYLFLLRLDLVYRHFQGEIVDPGTNDITPSYRSRRIYIESELIPLASVEWDRGKARVFNVLQLVSNTWIGETGRGYLQHGIWMDNDLSKFFSKLVVPEGSRIYPYYPLFCKYKTLCAQPVPPSPFVRKKILPLLHRVIALLSPEMKSIQASLKSRQFSEDIREFTQLRMRVPSSWLSVLSGISVNSYLNEKEQKEYSLEYRS